MPPKKKYVLSTTVRWSHFEVAVLRYLTNKTGQTVNDELRQLVRSRLQSLPGFDAKQFEKHMRGEELPQVDDEDLHKQFENDLKAFVASAGSGGWTFDDEEIKAVKSSAADFDL